MFKTIEYNLDRKPIKNYTEYVANSFAELPTAADGAELGDVSFYKTDDDLLGIAMFFDSGWIQVNNN